GHITYIFPEREKTNTSEIYGKIALDDSFIWHSRRPLLQPYILGAYDYDLYNGWYFEAGVKHDVVFEDLGLTISFVGDVGYVMTQQFFALHGSTDDTGFQHYDIGMIGSYSLNTLLNIPRRYGEFAIEGYLFYTDNLESDLRADTQVWGGVGID